MTGAQQRVAEYRGRVFRSHFRQRWHVIDAVPPMGDVHAVGLLIVPDDYLLCLCGSRLILGVSQDDAGVYVCLPCGRVVDMRRVA